MKEVACLCLFLFNVAGRGSAVQRLEVLCFRDRTLQGLRDISHSIIFEIQLPQAPLGPGKPFQKYFSPFFVPS